MSQSRAIAPSAAHQVDQPSSLVVEFGPDKPLELDCGVSLSPFTVAYQTYGELNAARSNARLITKW